ncbi:MAG: Lpg1974 family pore-forming outer membrane protein [Legionellales bacterium]|nr:Lpg1974 family pore-forming outer membrane protein [Legionellales bacterium]
MLNLKKTAVAVLAFGSSAVFAGTMGPVCTPGSVTVPCASSAWDFGVQALYLKPTYSGYPYQNSTVTVAANGDTLETYNAGPYNWGWGFKLEGSYHFSTGNDLNLNWYHLNHTTSRVLDVIPGTEIDSAITTTGSNQSRWDAVNLEFGQHAHFGEWKNIRFHGGVQFVSIRANAGLNINEPALTNVDLGGNIAANSDQKFNGFGPRIGADYWYNWGNGFAMYANGATGLYVGSQSFTNSLVVVDDANLLPTLTATGSATAVVPELEGKLGVKYTYAMAQGDLSLDAGWMWVNYWDALHTGIGGGLTKETNFAVNGPFVGLKWIGNVA